RYFIKMFGLFKRKKDVEELREGTKQGFDSVKKDISSISGWIKHLESENTLRKKDVEELKDILSSIQEEVEGIKNIVSMTSEIRPARVFKTPSPLSNKQTSVYPVQTSVQTSVQTPNLDQFSITERAIIWVLLNSDLKLSYDDLAAMLGKEKSTIRGQINTIKSKSDIIEEQIEKNGKKRVFIREEIKEKLLKKSKVRVSKGKKDKKNEEN
ncbi:MAG: hypothetical protein Q8O84_04540, partial [Nanoarchaeota archaeon]|nr:hypothetical protein [Nanoarchaeota archaeon]